MKFHFFVGDSPQRTRRKSNINGMFSNRAHREAQNMTALPTRCFAVSLMFVEVHVSFFSEHEFLWSCLLIKQSTSDQEYGHEAQNCNGYGMHHAWRWLRKKTVDLFLRQITDRRENSLPSLSWNNSYLGNYCGPK